MSIDEEEGTKYSGQEVTVRAESINRIGICRITLVIHKGKAPCLIWLAGNDGNKKDRNK